MDTGRRPSVGEAFERAPNCNHALLALCLTLRLTGPLSTRSRVRSSGPRRTHIPATSGAPLQRQEPRKAHCGRWTRERPNARNGQQLWPASGRPGGRDNLVSEQGGGASISAPGKSERSRQQPRTAAIGTAARCRFDGAARAVVGGNRNGSD